MTVAVTRTDWAMAQQIAVGGTVAVPSGRHEVVTVISGGPRSTTQVDAVTGPATHPLDVEHFAIRTGSSQDANVVVLVRTTGMTAVSVYTDTGTVTARPAHGPALIGAQFLTTLYDITAALDVAPAMECARIPIPWSLANPTSSAWDPAFETIVDDFMTEADSRGMKVITSSGSVPHGARSGGLGSGPPTTPATMGAFIQSIVDHWGDVLLCVNVYNEPNVNFTGAGHATRGGAERGAGRGRLPDIPVALSPMSLADIDWLESLLAAGLTGAMFDWVDLHPYPITTSSTRRRSG